MTIDPISEISTVSTPRIMILHSGDNKGILHAKAGTGTSHALYFSQYPDVHRDDP